MNIIIDTNIIRADFLFQSDQYKLFSEFVRRSKSNLVLPKVVFEEACFLYKQEIKMKKNNYREALSDILYFGNDSSVCSIADFIENINPNYETHLHNIFFYHWEILDYDGVDIGELIRRAIHRVRPFSTKGEGFRDATIWLSIINFLKNEKNNKTVFISNDKNAFSDRDNQELHAILKNDLANNQLELIFCNSIAEFLNKHAGEIFFFTKEWVIDHIDWNKINKQVWEAVETIHCGYFFTLYERVINKPLDYYYEIRNVEINKDWLDYHVYKKEGDKYVIELHFSGLTSINYFLENDQVQTISTEFFTETTVICTKKGILNYSGNYYEEESSIALPAGILGNNPGLS
ncbi:MAG: PIN domain-containing protein [Lacibacter sp.]